MSRHHRSPSSAFISLGLAALLPVFTAGCGLFGDDPEDGESTFELGGGVEKPEMTEEELLALCAELVEDGQTKAMKAQERVETLQNDLAANNLLEVHRRGASYVQPAVQQAGPNESQGHSSFRGFLDNFL